MKNNGGKRTAIILTLVGLATLLLFYFVFSRDAEELRPRAGDPPIESVQGIEAPAHGQPTPQFGGTESASEPRSVEPGTTSESSRVRLDDRARNPRSAPSERGIAALRKNSSPSTSARQQSALEARESESIDPERSAVLRDNAKPKVPAEHVEALQANANPVTPEELQPDLEKAASLEIPPEILKDFENPYPAISEEQLEILRKNAEPEE